MRTVPPSHVDLLTAPIVAVLTTLMPDGRPHSCLVWADYDGGCARINTTLQRRSGRNLLADPRVSLLVVDPDNTARYLQIRGEAELVRTGAVAHLDALTREYTGHPCFYGHVYPLAQRDRETRVTVRIRPRRVTVDAIHA
jgi:PPOX class probable F420-dependent enzyme